jgi:hypothetical protein
LKENITVLKQKIEQNHRKLQRVYPLTNIFLKNIDRLIESNPSTTNVEKWLDNHDNMLFCLKTHIDVLENKSF